MYSEQKSNNTAGESPLHSQISHLFAKYVRFMDNKKSKESVVGSLFRGVFIDNRIFLRIETKFENISAWYQGPWWVRLTKRVGQSSRNTVPLKGNHKLWHKRILLWPGQSFLSEFDIKKVFWPHTCQIFIANKLFSKRILYSAIYTAHGETVELGEY